MSNFYLQDGDKYLLLVPTLKQVDGRFILAGLHVPTSGLTPALRPGCRIVLIKDEKEEAVLCENSGENQSFGLRL